LPETPSARQRPRNSTHGLSSILGSVASTYTATAGPASTPMRWLVELSAMIYPIRTRYRSRCWPGSSSAQCTPSHMTSAVESIETV
jgi:hypothetical protein